MNKVRNRKSILIGIYVAITSALLFGLTPAFVKMAYSGGSNAISMTFIRSLFALPILYTLMKRKKISVRLSHSEVLPVVTICFFGNFGTTISLYSSYSYINVGIATVLHYIFPVIVTLINVFIFHEKFKWWKMVALTLGVGGVLTFMGYSRQNNSLGILLAAGSGFLYAGLLLGMEHSVLRDFHYFKMSFYSCLISAAAAFIYGTFSGNFVLNITPIAWGYSIIVSLLVSVCAMPLLKLAVAKCGATTTSTISLVEPISGVVFGSILLNERLTSANILGSVLILLEVVTVTLFSAPEKNK
jgi:drug/metabolite transporter (DMT)-like permease